MWFLGCTDWHNRYPNGTGAEQLGTGRRRGDVTSLGVARLARPQSVGQLDVDDADRLDRGVAAVGLGALDRIDGFHA